MIQTAMFSEREESDTLKSRFASAGPMHVICGAVREAKAKYTIVVVSLKRSISAKRPRGNYW
jgi:hypothetical protein